MEPCSWDPGQRLCKFFEQGTCTKGASCTFAHGLHELQASESFSSVSGGVCFKKWISKHIDLAAYEMRPGVRTMACKRALFLDSLRERLLAEGLIEMKTERTPTEGQLSMVVSSLWLAGSEQSAWWAKENTGGAKDLKTKTSRQPHSFSDLRRWLLYSTLSELLVLWSGRLFILGLRLSDHVKPLNPNSAVAFRGGDPHHTHHFSDS